MGGCLIHHSASTRTASFTLKFKFVGLFLLFFFIYCCEGQGARCNVNYCTQSYNERNDRLEAARKRTPDTDFSKRRCRILRRLHKCLHRTRKGCRGDLMFHSLQRGAGTNLERAKCSTSDKLSEEKVKNITVLLPQPTSQETKPKCFYENDDLDYKHCGMFGDPHLRTFFDTFYTCSVKKAWHLIDNDYMVAMATNVPIREGSEATVTTKITIIIKAAGECADQRHYVATNDRLPGAFTDGSDVAGSVTVVEIDPGNHVEIHAHYIATTVIIRKVAGFLTFAIKMPRALINGTSRKKQLCVHGCPEKHQLVPVKKIAPENPQSFASSHQSLNEADVITTRNKRAFSDSKQSGGSSAESFTKINEHEARKLCQQIILEIVSEELADADDLDAPGDLPNDTDSNDAPNKSSSSMASDAFTALVPASNHKNKHRGKRKNRMTQAKKPNADHSRSSFHRLFASDDKPELVLSEKSRHRKRKQQRHSKSKRDVSSVLPLVKKSLCNVSNFYFDSCVFDLMMTGDINFTLSAKVALLDLTRTHALGFDAPGASLEVVQRWGETPKDNCPNGSASKSILFSLIFICVTFSCLFINISSILTFTSSSNTVEKRRFKRSFTKPIQRTHMFYNSSERT